MAGPEQNKVVPLALRGIGMVCSLGLDWRSACAAARAGISRAAPLQHFTLKGPDGDVQGIPGHCTPILTHGFEGVARLIRLAQGALRDLVASLATLPDGAGFYVSLPHPRRQFAGAALMVDDQMRDDYERRSRYAGPGPEARTRAAAILSTALALAGWKQPFELRYVEQCGHAGVIRTLLAAMRDIANGRVSVAVVGGVDTLIGDETLQWYNDTGRLKTPAVAAGLQAGEAATFLLLGDARQPADGMPDMALIDTVQLASESHPHLDGDTPLGDGLAAVLQRLVELSGGEALRPWLLCDLNGELYRAHDWGHAAVRLRPRFDALTQAPMWLPAMATGDTGAASGAVAIARVAAAFERGYAPAEAAIVLSASDTAHRAACRIVAPTVPLRHSP